MTVEGACSPRFRLVREEFERNFAERGEVGASVCVNVGGETAVDLWGGVADRHTERPWQRDTVGLVWEVRPAEAAPNRIAFPRQAIGDLVEQGHGKQRSLARHLEGLADGPDRAGREHHGCDLGSDQRGRSRRAIARGEPACK